jgi:hypothetical protein
MWFSHSLLAERVSWSLFLSKPSVSRNLKRNSFSKEDGTEFRMI